MSKSISKKIDLKIALSLLFFLLFLLFFQHSLLFAGEALCSNGHIENFEHGSINWSTGSITAKGKAAPLKENKNKLSSSIPGAANADAMKNLIDILKNIKIARQSVEEFVASNDDIMAQFENTISDVSAIKQYYTSDGALEIEVKTSMYGSFLQFILPHTIAQIPEIHSIKVSDEVLKQRGKYTGLVLDTRGLKFKPLLYPIIKNEYGEEIYSELYINREYAVQRGICQYSCDMEKAVADKRVGANPLVLKGLRIGDESNSIIINKSDAEKIEKIIERHSFFKECRVIIVID